LCPGVKSIDFPRLRTKEIERYIELNLDRSEIDFVPAEMAERAEGSIDNLMKLVPAEMAERAEGRIFFVIAHLLQL